MFKVALLALFYGAQEQLLAFRLKSSMATARAIRTSYLRHYAVLEDWLQCVVRHGFATCRLESNMGTPWFIGPKPELDAHELRNHLIQTTGSDILRASCLHAQDAGLCMISTLHDSIMIESDARDASRDSESLARCMRTAAFDVIGLEIPAEEEFSASRYPLSDADAALFARAAT